MSPNKAANSNPSTSTVPPKKRRNPSIAEIGDSPTTSNTSSPLQQQPNHDDDEPANKRGKRHDESVAPATPSSTNSSSIAPTPHPPPTMMALPPPLLSYPPHHPHHLAVVQSPYYHPLYHAGPFYLPVGSPPQPPIAPQSPLPSSASPASIRPRSGSNTTRILPKLTTTATESCASTSLPSSSATNEATAATQAFTYTSPTLNPNNNGGSPADYHHHVYHPFALPIAAAPAASPSSPANVVAREGGGASTADQREQARKLSHSAIERRRRERINDKILQLRQLIPSCANQDHLHKMTVLQSAIDYITYLKDVVARLDGEDRVHVDLKMAKVPRSMVPKEVEAFTTQFSVNHNNNGCNSNSSSGKPQDISNSTAADQRSRRRNSSDDESNAGSSVGSTLSEQQKHKQPQHHSDGRASPEGEALQLDQQLRQQHQQQEEEDSSLSQKTHSAFDDQRGIKPIDVIKAGTTFTGNNMVATPVPSPLSVQPHEWTSSTLPSPMYRPPERGSNSSITSSPTTSPVDSPPHSWNNEDEQQPSSSSLPTPTLTPRQTTEPHQTKHMSLNNILC